MTHSKYTIHMKNTAVNNIVHYKNLYFQISYKFPKIFGKKLLTGYIKHNKLLVLLITSY